MNPKIINCIAQIRGGLIRIAINEGRWNNIKREDRICSYCNKGEIEDEQHFIFICPTWSGFRRQLRQYRIFKQNSIQDLFKTRDVNLLRDLYVYTIEALNMRDEINENLSI
jgi:hypothetical protein